MQVTLLAHASVLIEHAGFRLATDPWWCGPTYLGSWWHFPEPAVPAGLEQRLDAVYITHEHADHFHPPTLARLPRELPVYVPRFFLPRFRRKLECLGFTRVRELDHGQPCKLAPDLRITSYQSRADDSLLVVESAAHALLNLNDNILCEELRAEVSARHRRFDLMLRSFANAESYPIVYTLLGEEPAPDWDPRRLLDSFVDEVQALRPRCFAPFASLFCFLREENVDLNRHVHTPEALFRLAAAAPGLEARAVDLKPGDVFDLDSGDVIPSSRVSWADKPALLAEMRTLHAPEIEALRARERDVPDLAPLARRGFADLWRRLPGAVRRRTGLCVLFRVAMPDGGFAGFRLADGQVEGADPDGDGWDLRVRVPAWPLAEVLLGHDTWASLQVSCRMRLDLKPWARARELVFWTALLVDDLGYWRWRDLLGPRSLRVSWQRRRELWAYARDLAAGRFVSRRLRKKYG